MGWKWGQREEETITCNVIHRPALNVCNKIDLAKAHIAKWSAELDNTQLGLCFSLKNRHSLPNRLLYSFLCPKFIQPYIYI
uniref:Uncharacterized protein n=1 Tax=Octopus bimaculoides TaxID=37653 RepID=A0A0L8H3H9_OCTBM